MSDEKIQPVDKVNIQAQHAPWLIKFIDIYQRLSVDNLHLLAELYHQEIIFIDPMHQLTGFEQLKRYFDGLYQKLSYCEFNIEQVIAEGQDAAIYWQMSYQHPRLNGGEVVKVQGSSHLRGCDDKVIFHRDYIDLGAMLYEHVPLLGRVIRLLKTRATTS